MSHQCIILLCTFAAFCSTQALGSDSTNAIKAELMSSNVSDIYTTLERLEQKYNSNSAKNFFAMFRDRLEEGQAESLRECAEELKEIMKLFKQIADNENVTIAEREELVHDFYNNATTSAIHRFQFVMKYAMELVLEDNKTYNEIFDEEEQYISALQNESEKFEDFKSLYNTSLTFAELLEASDNFSEKWNETKSYGRFVINQKTFLDETMKKTYELVENLSEAYDHLRGVYSNKSSLIETIFEQQQEYMAKLDIDTKKIIDRLTDIETEDFEDNYDDDDSSNESDESE